MANPLIQRCLQNKSDLQQSVWRVSRLRCRDLHPPSSASSSSFESTQKAEERYSQAALDSTARSGWTVLSECGLHTVSQPPDQQPSGLKQQWIWSGPQLKEQQPFTLYFTLVDFLLVFNEFLEINHLNNVLRFSNRGMSGIINSGQIIIEK